MPGSQAEVALRRSGLRVTRRRLEVLHALEGRPDFVTAQALHHELRARGARPGLATVYRALTGLADAGVVDTVERSGERSFRLCGPRHHHHLVCEACGRVEEVTSAEIESWVRRIARRTKFRVTAHSAEIFGVCAACR